MARPKLEETRDKELRIRLTDKEYDDLNELSKYIEIPVTTLARNFLLSAKDDANFYKKIGLLKGAKKFIEFNEKFKEMIKK